PVESESICISQYEFHGRTSEARTLSHAGGHDVLSWRGGFGREFECLTNASCWRDATLSQSTPVQGQWPQLQRSQLTGAAEAVHAGRDNHSDLTGEPRLTHWLRPRRRICFQALHRVLYLEYTTEAAIILSSMQSGIPGRFPSMLGLRCRIGGPA